MRSFANVRVLVPAERAAEARALLAETAEPPDETESEET